MKMNAIKETICTRCAHRKVCAYKDDCLSVVEAASRITISKPLPDGRVEINSIKDFAFVEGISITCRYYDNLDYTTSKSY